LFRAIAFGLVGGLGLSLFGMQIMGEGLQKAAGEKMRRILEALTNSPAKGVAIGTIVTAVIQSSSATTVMVVGFVNAGLMTLRQAVGVIMGANIGTTVTAQLVAFHLVEYALPAIGIGFALSFLGRTRQQKYVGQVLLGFGILFLGMGLMGDAMKPLRTYRPFVDMLASFGRYPVLGILAGMVFTAIIQSSSATTGLVVTLCSRGLMTIYEAVPLILGANIGTCVTALIASVGTNLGARRAAMAHLLFNVGGVVLFLPFLNVLTSVAMASSASAARQAANVHTLFNVTNTFIVLPFVDRFVQLVMRLVPGEQAVVERGPKYLDQRLLSTPSVAIAQARKEAVRMARFAQENLENAIKGFFSNKPVNLSHLHDIEDCIDEIEEAINVYLARLSQRSLSEAQSRTVALLLQVANDIERVGDHAETIAELGEYRIEQRLPFSERAMEELTTMYGLVRDTFAQAVQALESGDEELAARVAKMDDVVDQMEKDLRVNHIKRLNEGKCYPASGVVFLDLISNLERIGDHAVNIADAVLGRF